MIYVDLVFLINLIYDFLILNAVNIVLRRNIKVKRIFMGSLVGSLSILSLYFRLFSNTYITISFSLFILLITFGYKDIIYFKNNVLYFYMISVIFGGFLYLVNLKFLSYSHGIGIYNYRILINFIATVILSPVIYILHLYTYKNNHVKHLNYYPVKFVFDNYMYDLNAFYDSGNLIKDPYRGRPVIIVESEVLNGDIKNKSPIYVPFKTVNNNSLLKCYKPDLLIVNDKVINNCLIGLWEGKTLYDGVRGIISGYIGDKIR